MASYTEEKEREYQNAIVEMMKDERGLGYTYLGNFQYAKGETARNGGVRNGNVIEGELRQHLHDAGYTQLQIDTATRKLIEASSLPSEKFADLLERNAAFYDLLVSGAKAKPTPEETEKDVAYIDFKYPGNNRFSFAEEVSYIDPITGKHSRPTLIRSPASTLARTSWFL